MKDLCVDTFSTDTVDVTIDEPSSRDVTDTNDSFEEDKAEEKTEQNNKLVNKNTTYYEFTKYV